MTSTEIRNNFLKFFEERGHKIVPSAPVIPYDDPTLLFTNAGMNQFKDVFLGTGKRDYVRSVDSQKCIRVSGKHNDLEEVGRDTYHHTFFEMLGNWSFGDYYKKEAIGWAWELLTKVWGLEKKRLYATVYETDDEAEQLWKNVTDIDPSHVLRFGKKDNFWEMGETGPCGPCSEIHIDLTPDYSGGNLVNVGDPRVMEIWNLVFIQYDRDASGKLTPLPAKHVDTGMGFERICAVLQKKKSNYDTDVFTPIINHIAKLAGKGYQGTLDGQTDIAMRVIADHVRMLSFSIADGGIPSNEGRGYVMRRILRRAARFGRNLDMHEPFIYKVVEAVVKSMGNQYSEIKEKQLHIERMIKGEEESFNATLDIGLSEFEIIVADTIENHLYEKKFNKKGVLHSSMRGGNLKVWIDGSEMNAVEIDLGDNIMNQIGERLAIRGEDVFKLYDTFGFPTDLTEMMARDRGLTVDLNRFNELMEGQRERARDAGKSKSIPQILVFMNKDLSHEAIEFVGYEQLESEAEITSVGENFLILNRTPFYAESGGQVGDIGYVTTQKGSLRILDTIKKNDIIAHQYEGSVGKVGWFVRAKVDVPRRHNIERNHTATHLMHEALRRVIGTHSHQQGSLVAPDHLRFDFNHFEKITLDQLKAIEDIVNEKIAEDIKVYALNDPKEWLTIDEAKKKYPNVKMFFGDKYGDKVRIVEIDPKFSVELCGGTHVKNTKDIGLFKIIAESSIASGIRRIEAVSGEGFGNYIWQQLKKVGEMDEQIAKLIDEKEELEKQLGVYKKIEPTPRSSLGKVSVSTESLTMKTLEEVEQANRQRDEVIEFVTKSTNDLKKELSKYRVKEASSNIEDIIAKGVALNGFKVVSAKIDVGNAEELKAIGDTLRSKISSGVGVLGAVVDDKVALVCVVTDDLIKEKKLQAGKIVGEIAKRVGGGGGGRPHLATAGGKDVEKLDEALNATISIIKKLLQ